jgi:ribonuclease HII
LKKASGKTPKRLLSHDLSFLDQGVLSLAGVDEAGRGPLAGPVVASAVIVRDFSFSSRIDDSKKMTLGARELAYREITQKCAVGVSVVGCDVIDEINIFQASMLAMREAVSKLPRVPDCLLIDGPHAPGVGCRQVPIIDGDAISFSIACASIVAKVTRDRLMEEMDAIYPGYGFKDHKGYSTEEHFSALDRLGPCGIHRRSFEPVRLALEKWKRF